MISFTLACENDHEFEAWFRNSGDFDAQVDKGIVDCPSCGSTKISKSLMAPQVSGTKKKGKSEVVATPDPDAAQLRTMLKAVRDHVVDNADYVGDKFAEEAQIYFGEAKKRGIYGEASSEETKELNDEGIEFYPLPVLPEDRN